MNMSKKRKEALYVQCSLQRGNTHHMAWIPKQFAVVGNYIKIKKDNDWEDGWKVTGDGGGLTKSAEETNNMARINLPSIQNQ